MASLAQDAAAQTRSVVPEARFPSLSACSVSMGEPSGRVTVASGRTPGGPGTVSCLGSPSYFSGGALAPSGSGWDVNRVG